MAAVRRWALFGIALASLVMMTYAGVLLAFSVRLTPELLDANRDLPEAGRAIVVPIADPQLVRTHAATGEGALLAAGKKEGAFAANAQDVTLGRALAWVPIGTTANVTLTDVPSRNGTSNLTVDAAALAGGREGWIVMGSGEEAPRFYAREEVLGEVARFSSGAALGWTFAAGIAGFVAPLVALIFTHRPSGKKGALEFACRECGAAMPRGAEFCLRCGAYRSGDADA